MVEALGGVRPGRKVVGALRPPKFKINAACSLPETGRGAAAAAAPERVVLELLESITNRRGAGAARPFGRRLERARGLSRSAARRTNTGIAPGLRPDPAAFCRNIRFKVEWPGHGRRERWREHGRWERGMRASGGARLLGPRRSTTGPARCSAACERTARLSGVLPGGYLLRRATNLLHGAKKAGSGARGLCIAD